MVRPPLRCACWVFVGMLSLSMLCYSHSVAELEKIVGSDAVREVSMAAGLALADYYAESKTAADLEALAEAGRTPGIRLAAQTALDLLADPLQPLIILGEEELKALAISAVSSAERLNAARAYYLKIREDLSADKLESDATESQSEELALAAGEALAGFYASFDPMSEADLMDQALHGASQGMRVAAGLALASHLIRTSSLTEVEITVKIMEHTMIHTELAEAYMRVLAHRFSARGDVG
jgi:hypothetical protein